MNIRDFEIFKTIAECGSFSRASEKLFIAQPSLSKTIQKLEKNWVSSFSIGQIEFSG